MKRSKRRATISEATSRAGYLAMAEGDRRTLGELAGAALALNGGAMPESAAQAEALGHWTETTAIDAERVCPEA